MRVVFDTNIFVSALVRPGGPSERALLKIIEGTDQLIVSRPIHELLAVLSRKFGRDQEELARVAVYISELGGSSSHGSGSPLCPMSPTTAYWSVWLKAMPTPS